MLENINGSLDVKFSKDIHTIAESLETLAKSVAIIAGAVARREGIGYQEPDVLLRNSTGKVVARQQQQASNTDPLSTEDTKVLERSIGKSYDNLADFEE